MTNQQPFLHLRRVGLYLLLAWLIGGCSAPATEVTPTTTATAAAPPTSMPGVLFRDDFANPNSGWETGKDDTATFGYHPPQFYHIEVRVPYNKRVVSRGLSFGDFRVEAPITVDHTGTPRSGDFRYGLIFRRSGEKYYAFVVSPVSYNWQVIKYGPQGETTLAQGSDYTINGMQLTDLLRVDAKGSDFTFYINGHTLAQTKDREYVNGDIGFIVQTLDERLAHVHFGTLTVRPSEVVAIVPTATTVTATVSPVPTATETRPATPTAPPPTPTLAPSPVPAIPKLSLPSDLTACSRSVTRITDFVIKDGKGGNALIHVKPRENTTIQRDGTIEIYGAAFITDSDSYQVRYVPIDSANIPQQIQWNNIGAKNTAPIGDESTNGLLVKWEPDERKKLPAGRYALALRILQGANYNSERDMEACWVFVVIPPAVP